MRVVRSFAAEQQQLRQLGTAADRVQWAYIKDADLRARFLGSYVLADTPSSSLSAPYHRMAWGNLAAHAALSAPVDQALAQAKALHTAYVLECRAHRRHFDRSGLPSDALQRRLDAGRPPDWLVPLSPSGATLEVYRVANPG